MVTLLIMEIFRKLLELKDAVYIKENSTIPELLESV